MVRRFFHNILTRRHFWRYASYDQVAELYASRVLRMTAQYLMNAFVSIYLYQIGYTIPMIALLWTGFYFFKTAIGLPSARLVAWIGPKHSIMVSNLLYIPAMVLYTMLPGGESWMLFVAFGLQAVSAMLYSIGYAVDFSKVKSPKHAGREIAFMNIFEKVTTGLSPVVGGFIAYFWGPQVVITIAAILFALAAVPLMRTGEPIRINQHLTFRGFPWRLLRRHSIAQAAYGFDVFSSGTVWSLYIGVIVIGISDSSNEVYAVTGILTSVVFVAAILSSYTYGRLIDRRKGGSLLKIATIGSALTHLVRPFVQTPVMAAGVNASHELATTGYLLPYTRAIFDNADLSGARVAYIGWTEVISNFGAGLAAAILTVAATTFDGEFAIRNFFFLSAAAVLLIATARFPLYKNKR